MKNCKSRSKSYWPYYFSLETDVDKMSRYIEFEKSNFSTYSIELVRLILAIGSEIDVVMKAICNELQPNKQAKNIDDYRKTIMNSGLDKFNSTRVICTKFSFDFIPWKQWKNETSPEWWRTHNDIKHERNKFYEEANLGNMLESLAGLYLCNIYLSN